MSNTRSIAVPNALLLISDIGGGRPPDVMEGALIASTPSCIAVGCMSDSNGETEVTLASMPEFDHRERPAFEGELETPNRAVAVWTALRETVLQAPVSHVSTKVRVWVNHPTEPNKVIVGLG
jgi:hypothetical protein